MSKRYKLLKDLPLAKAGTEVKLHDILQQGKIYSIRDVNGIDCGNILSKDIPEWIGEIQENKRWRAEIGEQYFYVTNYGEIIAVDERHDKMDEFNFMRCNYFKTEEDAQKYLDYIKAVAKLNDIIDEENGDWKPSWKDESSSYCEIYLDHSDGTYEYEYPGYYQSKTVINTIKNGDTAQKIIDNHKDLLDIIFNY